MAPPGRFDIYDDTARAPRRSARVPRANRDNRDASLDMGRRAERRARAGASNNRYGENDGGLSLFEQFDRDMDIFQSSVFGDFFGDRSAGDAVSRRRDGNRNSFFGDMRPFASFNSSSGDNGGGSGFSNYVYESHTETMGPDGRVRRETVRSRPGADGRPATERIVHDEATGRSHRTTSRHAPVPSMLDDMFSFGLNSFNTRRPMGVPPPGDGNVEIRDVTEEEHYASASNRSSRRSSARNARPQQVIVQEPVDDYPIDDYGNADENLAVNANNGNRNTQRRRRSSNRSGHHAAPRKTFLDRARDWGRRS